MAIRDNVNELVDKLTILDKEYKEKDAISRKSYYYKKRDSFNELIANTSTQYSIEKASLFIFLNKTCFNGLYRVNSKGLFNVPIGSYKNPLICDVENLTAVSEKLKNVKINNKNYLESLDFIDKNTFVYIDPPYRPLSRTSNFTAYTKLEFNDDSQIELSNFAKEIDKVGAKIMLSNSDPKNVDESDTFFDDIYKGFNIFRIEANRMINSKAKNRGKISELLITNY